MGSILERGPNQCRVQIRHKGVNLCKTFETMAEAKEWERITEGKVAAKEPVARQAPAILSEACKWFEGRIGNPPVSSGWPQPPPLSRRGGETSGGSGEVIPALAPRGNHHRHRDGHATGRARRIELAQCESGSEVSRPYQNEE
jgi:hypothetical protein